MKKYTQYSQYFHFLCCQILFFPVLLLAGPVFMFSPFFMLFVCPILRRPSPDLGARLGNRGSDRQKKREGIAPFVVCQPCRLSAGRPY